MKPVNALPVAAPLDLTRVRADFPMLGRTMRGRPLVYLDNANSTQKPRSVIDAESRFYSEQYSNIHRGVYLLSQEATEAAWVVVEPVLADHHPSLPYAPGTWGPAASDALIAGDGGWHNPQPEPGAAPMPEPI